VAVTAFAGALLAGVAAPGVATAAPERDRPGLRETMREIVDAGFLGVQLRVHDEQGDWAGSAGARKVGATAPPATNGHFRVGSATKAFASTLVLQLVDEGEVGLDAPAADHLPEYGLDRRITVRMLLRHTSGIFNFTGEYFPDGSVVPGIPWQGKDWVDNRFHTYRPEELVRFDPAAARAAGHRVTGRPVGDPRAARPRLPPLRGRRPAEDGRRHPPEPHLDLHRR
jgi:D-alanyl-D-alanine carboxypeptidase